MTPTSKTQGKSRKVKAWVILGTDNSIISEVFWWKEHARESWLNRWISDGDLKITPITITYSLPKKGKVGRGKTNKK